VISLATLPVLATGGLLLVGDLRSARASPPADLERPGTIHPFRHLPEDVRASEGEWVLRVTLDSYGRPTPLFLNDTDAAQTLDLDQVRQGLVAEALDGEVWRRVTPVRQQPPPCGLDSGTDVPPGHFFRAWGPYQQAHQGETGRLRYRLLGTELVSDEWTGTWSPDFMLVARMDDAADPEERAAVLREVLEARDRRLGWQGPVQGKVLELLLHRLEWDPSPYRRIVIEDRDHPLRAALLEELWRPAPSDAEAAVAALARDGDPQARDLVRLASYSAHPEAEERMRRAMGDDPLGQAWVDALLVLRPSHPAFDPKAWRWPDRVQVDEPLRLPIVNTTEDRVVLRFRDPVELVRLGTDAWPRPFEIPPDAPRSEVSLAPGDSWELGLLLDRHFEFVPRTMRHPIRIELAVPGLPEQHWDFRAAWSSSGPSRPLAPGESVSSSP